jgi:hypothetical protein
MVKKPPSRTESNISQEISFLSWIMENYAGFSA